MQKIILLVEDNLGFRVVFTDFLEASGYKVLQAEDGNTGLERATNFHPDLILLDLILPGLHGFDVLKELKANSTTQKIPVIVLSVLDEPKDQKKALELGAVDSIVKGSDSPQQIIKRIKDFI